MGDGWAVRLLRILWIIFLIGSSIQVKDEISDGFYFIKWILATIIFFIGWVIAILIPLQYILLGSINPKVLIEDFIK